MNAGTSAQALVQWTLMPAGAGERSPRWAWQHRAAAETRDEAASLRGRVEELEALVEELGDHSRSMEGFAAAAAHQLSEPLIVAESGTIMITEELGDDARSRPAGPPRRDRARRRTGPPDGRRPADGCPLSGGVELEPVSSERVVALVLDDLGARMRERGVVAEIGTLPDVRAERRLLAVIYHNLITNALKYGPRDGGSIRLDAEPHDGDWRLTVTSGGAPLQQDEIRRIFEPWRRDPRRAARPGSGLGLAICARLVQRLGGTIGVEPEPEGNTFYFVLAAA